MIQDQNSEFGIRIQNSEFQARIKGFSSIFNLLRRLGAAFTLHRLVNKLAVKVSRISVHLALLHGVLELDERVVLWVWQACAICAGSSLEHVHLATRDMTQGIRALCPVSRQGIMLPMVGHTMGTSSVIMYACCTMPGRKRTHHDSARVGYDTRRLPSVSGDDLGGSR